MVVAGRQVEIGNSIRELRQLMRLRQEKFAVKLGVTFPTLNCWENHRGVPSSGAIARIEGLQRSLGRFPSDTLRSLSYSLLKQYFSEEQ